MRVRSTATNSSSKQQLISDDQLICLAILTEKNDVAFKEQIKPFLVTGEIHRSIKTMALCKSISKHTSKT